MTQVRIVKQKVQGRPYPTGARGSISRRSYYANSRAYVFTEGETILENLEGRRRRPVKAFKAILLQAHPELEGKVRWSQTAGCGCGCSPGFIINHTVRADDHRPADIFLTITADPEVQEPVEDTSYVEMALA